MHKVSTPSGTMLVLPSPELGKRVVIKADAVPLAVIGNAPPGIPLAILQPGERASFKALRNGASDYLEWQVVAQWDGPPQASYLETHAGQLNAQFEEEALQKRIKAKVREQWGGEEPPEKKPEPSRVYVNGVRVDKGMDLDVIGAEVPPELTIEGFNASYAPSRTFEPVGVVGDIRKTADGRTFEICVEPGKWVRE